MSIVLLEPPRPKNPDRFEEVVNAPLSACLFTGYIASVLRENKIEAEIVNAYLMDWSTEETITHVSKKSLLLLCIHTVYLWERTQDIFNMMSALKTMNSNVHINLYGYYPTFAYEKILSCFRFIDSVTVGEPEFTTLDLARWRLSAKCNTAETPDGRLLTIDKNTPARTSLTKETSRGLKNNFLDTANISGLAFRNTNGEIVFNPRPPFQNVDRLPYPDRQDIKLCQKKGIVTYIQGSRGCYGHCSFCYLNPFYEQTNLWRCRSAKNIFDEILKLYNDYLIRNFYFSDANFFGPGKQGKERAITLSELILAHDLDIHFGFECRANDIEEYSISRLVMAGLANVFLGLESGDPASLKRFKKHTTVDESKNAIQLLRDYGIEPSFGFIMFEPNSTMESIRNNFEFLRETGIMTTPAVTAHLLHHRQTIFAGTSDYQSMMNESAYDNTSFTNYELFYKIKDPKAEAFSEIISHVCKTVLSLIPKTFSCDNTADSAGNESNVLPTLNNALVTIFEKTLSDFETNATLYNPDATREISLNLAHELEMIIGKQSVTHFLLL